MKFKILEAIPNNNYDLYEKSLNIINSKNDLDNLNIEVKNILLNDDYFINNTLILVIFFDGSNPKRYIKDLVYNEENNELLVVTNKEDITFSTMDYRIHLFLIEIPKINVKTLNIK